MSESGNVASDVSDDAVEEALSDHHLDEIAQMVEQAHAHKPFVESPFSDTPSGDPSASAREGGLAREARA